MNALLPALLLSAPPALAQDARPPLSQVTVIDFEEIDLTRELHRDWLCGCTENWPGGYCPFCAPEPVYTPLLPIRRDFDAEIRDSLRLVGR